MIRDSSKPRPVAASITYPVGRLIRGPSGPPDAEELLRESGPAALASALEARRVRRQPGRIGFAVRDPVASPTIRADRALSARK